LRIASEPHARKNEGLINRCSDQLFSQILIG
jgi:hypothetical protein